MILASTKVVGCLYVDWLNLITVQRSDLDLRLFSHSDDRAVYKHSTQIEVQLICYPCEPQPNTPKNWRKSLKSSSIFSSAAKWPPPDILGAAIACIYFMLSSYIPIYCAIKQDQRRAIDAMLTQDQLYGTNRPGDSLPGDFADHNKRSKNVIKLPSGSSTPNSRAPKSVSSSGALPCTMPSGCTSR